MDTFNGVVTAISGFNVKRVVIIFVIWEMVAVFDMEIGLRKILLILEDAFVIILAPVVDKGFKISDIDVTTY